jgi:phytoene synthase
MSAAESYAHCGAIARTHMRDHWIAALFAPEPKRRHLHALAAFAFETAKVKTLVKEPLAGEMRLTWWIEAIEGLRDGEAVSHPVAAAVIATIEEAGLPRARFEDWLLARRDELYGDASPDETEARRLYAPLFALAALALGAAAENAAARAGEAQALGKGEPAAALGRIAAAEAALAGADPAILPAFAPLAAMRLDAKRALKGRGPAPGWRRQIAIWRWGP